MKFVKIAFIVILAFFVSSCLTVEKKKYCFEITGKGSGTLTITYINIFSQMNDSVDVSEEDFDTLINDYINGTTIEDNYPLATNIKKELYEENGFLNAKVTMNFSSFDAVRLYQFDSKSPICFNVGQTIDGESFESSNGTLGNSDYMNVVFWPKKTKVLEVVTTVNQYDSENCVSLVNHYRKWKN